MDDATKVEQPKLTAQDFAKRYQELCDELGYRIVVSPQWMARDDNTFSMVLNYTIGQIQQPKKE